MGAIKELTLPWPDRDLQSNGRANFYKKARLTKEARNHAWAVAMETPKIECMPNAHLFIEYYPKTYRGDIHNVASSLKAYIDGIAEAMGCDDKEFTVHYPIAWAGKSPAGKIIIKVVPAK